MTNQLSTITDKDQVLWKIAKARTSFKRNATAYIIVNVLLWGIWYFTAGPDGYTYPWPAWTTLGWGIGLAFQFREAYVPHGSNNTEREYQKLKNQQ